MENNSLKNLAERLAKSRKIKEEKEKRKAYYRSIGRKGGLVKKVEKLKLKNRVSTRITDDEYRNFKLEMKKYNLSQAKLLRLKITNTELKINEFIEDEQLFLVLTNMKRIGNLLKHSSFSNLANDNSFKNLFEETLKLLKENLKERLQNSQ